MKLEYNCHYRNQWLTNFKTRELENDKYVLISPSGGWEMLTEKELNYTRGISMPTDLFEKLEKKNLIITQKNTKEVFKDYEKWNRPNYTHPSLHIIVTTKRCNLQCSYCHASAVPSQGQSKTSLDLQIHTAKSIVDFIYQSPSESVIIEFQGGESLLNFETVQWIVRYVKEKNQNNPKKVRFSLVTNLLLLKPEQCKFIKDNNIGLCTSLDGPAFLHDQQRYNNNGKGSYQALIKSIEMLRDEGMRSPGILLVMTRQSMPFYKELLDMLVELGLKEVSINYVQPLGKARENWGKIGIDIDERINNYKKVLDYTISLWEKGIFVVERFFRIALDKILKDQDTSFTDFKNPCGMVMGQLTYTPDGYIYTCDEGRNDGRFKLGHVEQDSYSEIMRSPHALDLISQSIPSYAECNQCAYKVYCGICPVLNHILGIPQTSDSSSQNDPRCKLNLFLYDYIFKKIMNEIDVIKSFLIYKGLS